ncbi:MAG: hypothetical protein RLZZ299_174 [Pseudomonadota bacterium]
MLLLLLHAALADETVLTLSGTLPDDGTDHAFLPFQVPEGTVEVEVRHDDLSDANVLDWGLDDPDGFRGWGGGNTEPAIVGLDAASRSYLAGPMPPGTWRVVIGKALLVDVPAPYEVEVVLRTEATLSPDPARAPYTDAAPLRTGWAWYAGDLHVHSRDSGDARPALDEVAAFAGQRGLDFVVVTDHNTVAQQERFADAQGRSPGVLLVPGIEYTTYDGHAGLFGATGWIDHRIGTTGTLAGLVEAVRAQDALLVVNHPNLDLGDRCLGCAWRHADLDPAALDAIEVITGGWAPVGQLFFDANLATWEAWLDAGARTAPVGGSDDHDAGLDDGPTASPIGSPTTRLYASDLSVPALREALRAGRTMVQLQGPDDPLVALTIDGEAPGDAVADADPAWVATVEGGDGAVLVWIVDGDEVARVPVVGDAFSDPRSFGPTPTGARVRLQLEVDGAPRVLTGYRWSLPYVSTPGEAGCGCAAAASPVGAGGLACAILVAIRRRRTRA